MKILKTIGIALVVITLLIVGLKVTQPSEEQKKAKREQLEKERELKRQSKIEIEAYDFAKELVKNKLKSPSSAIFPEDGKAYFTEGEYFVISHVDSQNSYGAMLRKNFSCTLDYKDGKFSVSKKLIMY